MIDFRPHIMSYAVQEDGYKDDDGIYHKGTTTFNGSIPCRASRNGKATEIALTDGTTFIPQYTVYYDIDCDHKFKSGDNVRITDNAGNTICEETVKGEPQKGQLHNKLWL